MNEKTKQQLEEFVIRSRQISTTRFMAMAAEDRSLAIQFSGEYLGDWQLKGSWPDDEAVGNAARLIRFFIQDNEPTSLRRMEEAVISDSSVSQELRDEIVNARNWINQLLDAPKLPLGNIVFDGESLTRRTIMDTVLYGELVHSNKSKREIYRNWMEDAFFAPLIIAVFNSTLDVFIQVIQNIAVMCEKELKSQ